MKQGRFAHSTLPERKDLFRKTLHLRDSEICFFDLRHTDQVGKQLLDTYYTAPISNNNTVEDTINPSKRANLLKQDLYKLLETLNWSSFYECDKKCNFDEVCYTPTWGPSPFGWGPGTNHHGTVTRNVSWFQDNGEFYSIGNQLKCVNYRDVLTYKNGN